ncbi:hypothetical protein POSPLADRAFT_1043032 [Postia placenta MAD-698-R-SB12]|uniref:Uncharacterized protein n=1 Tax=Postia placenta MAD-698-R-SB12 TaxID=670580 RepID=A0A1X6NGS4_9APHY|nr:hypothetical protein POSPLADRAFT_1043032 [Postia placenta MAD-698-R-SB12]OSX67841.1 hypothetical protein POSPLADRAFT_1043032 [Postia placenta MAD-698-R-SB12]
MSSLEFVHHPRTPTLRIFSIREPQMQTDDRPSQTEVRDIARPYRSEAADAYQIFVRHWPRVVAASPYLGRRAQSAARTSYLISDLPSASKLLTDPDVQEEKTPAEDLETLVFVTRCFAGPQEDSRVIIKWCCYSLQRSTEPSYPVELIEGKASLLACEAQITCRLRMYIGAWRAAPRLHKYVRPGTVTSEPSDNSIRAELLPGGVN